jgi:hypothetical protein
MSFPNKSFNNVLPGEPVCIRIKGVYSWYTEEQIKEYIESVITLKLVKIVDLHIEEGNSTNDVYVCFSDWFVERGVSYRSYEMECMTEAFAYGVSFAIPAPYIPMIEFSDAEWVCYYEDSILSYSDIMKVNEPITDAYVNVIVGVETDDLCDNYTVSTHSSMPELIDAADADDEDMDVDDEEEEEEDNDEDNDDDEEEEEEDMDVDEDEDDEEDDEEDEDEDDEDDEDEDDDNDEEDKQCNVEHNISQVLDWVVLKFDLNDTKTVIRLLIALNYLNVFVNLVLLMFILKSL